MEITSTRIPTRETKLPATIIHRRIPLATSGTTGINPTMGLGRNLAQPLILINPCTHIKNISGTPWVIRMTLPSSPAIQHIGVTAMALYLLLQTRTFRIMGSTGLMWVQVLKIMVEGTPKCRTVSIQSRFHQAVTLLLNLFGLGE
jgi:hypothetical protein